jgi:hypothetical protein
VNLVVTFTPRFARIVAGCLLATALFLTLLSASGQVLYHFVEGWLSDRGRELLREATDTLYVDEEESLPTIFASYLLLLCAHLFAAIALTCRATGARYALRWGGLSLIFVYLFVDETYTVHEKTIVPLRAVLGTGGLLYFAWVVPAAFFLLLFVLVYFRFLIDLPAPIRGLFLLAGAMFVGGSLGVEMLGGYFWEQYGEQSFPFVAASTVEELMEMLGVVVLIYALMLYVSLHLKRISIRLGPHNKKA